MTKPTDFGGEIARYLDPNGRLVSMCADGVTLAKSLSHPQWRVIFRKKADVPLERWREGKLARLAELPAWRREVRCLPSMRQIEEWAYDSMCETVTGDTVEPDGHGPDGAPSWLLALAMI